jgi:p-hydroxybenzoate 3-monooxygenase
MLEQGSVDLLVQTGAGARLRRQGMIHHGIELRFEGKGHRIPLSELTGGRSITVYGQQEVVKDLIRLRLAAGGEVVFDAEALSFDDLASDRPTVNFKVKGESVALRCDYVAGCDGFWGIS